MTNRALCGMALVLALLTASCPATPLITSFSPTQAPALSAIDVFGSGFTGTTAVHFDPDNLSPSAQFTVISDTHLRVIAPLLNSNSPNEHSIIVQVGSTATVTLGSDTVKVTGNTTALGGVHFYEVQSGGTLTYGGGSGLVFVDSGGTWNNTPGGGRMVALVQSNGTYTTSDGGFTTAYAETGANLSVTLAVQTIGLTDLQISHVPSNFTYGRRVPEPATLLLAATMAPFIPLALRLGRSKR